MDNVPDSEIVVSHFELRPCFSDKYFGGKAVNPLSTLVLC